MWDIIQEYLKFRESDDHNDIVDIYAGTARELWQPDGLHLILLIKWKPGRYQCDDIIAFTMAIINCRNNHTRREDDYSITSESEFDEIKSTNDLLFRSFFFVDCSYICWIRTVSEKKVKLTWHTGWLIDNVPEKILMSKTWNPSTFFMKGQLLMQEV